MEHAARRFATRTLISHALLLEVLTSSGVGTLIRGASANRANHR